MPSTRQNMANAPVLVDEATGLANFTITSAGGPTNTTGEISDEAGNVLPLKSAQIQVEPGLAADNVVVAAVGGKKIRVLSYNFSLGAAADATFRSNTTPISAKGYQVLGGEEKASDGSFLFETAAGEALNLLLSGAVNVSCQVIYAEV